MESGHILRASHLGNWSCCKFHSVARHEKTQRLLKTLASVKRIHTISRRTTGSRPTMSSNHRRPLADTQPPDRWLQNLFWTYRNLACAANAVFLSPNHQATWLMSCTSLKKKNNKTKHVLFAACQTAASHGKREVVLCFGENNDEPWKCVTSVQAWNHHTQLLKRQTCAPLQLSCQEDLVLTTLRNIRWEADNHNKEEGPCRSPWLHG